MNMTNYMLFRNIYITVQVKGVNIFVNSNDNDYTDNDVLLTVEYTLYNYSKKVMTLNGASAIIYLVLLNKQYATQSNYTLYNEYQMLTADKKKIKCFKALTRNLYDVFNTITKTGLSDCNLLQFWRYNNEMFTSCLTDRAKQMLKEIIDNYRDYQTELTNKKIRQQKKEQRQQDCYDYFYDDVDCYYASDYTL